MPGPWESIRQLFRDAAKTDVAAAEERIRAAEPRRGRFSAAERRVTCSHCSGSDYVLSYMSMHTNVQAFWDLEWLGPTAWTLTCTTCGKIEMFAKKPTSDLEPTP